MKRKEKNQHSIEYFMKLPYSVLLHQVEDEGKKYWIAEIPELPGCKSHGETIEEAIESVEEAKKDWILDSLEDGEEIPVPIERDRFSGRTLLRMSRSLHRALSLLAETEKLSLNQLIVTILAKEVGRLGVLNQIEGKLENLLAKLEKNKEQTELASMLNSVAQNRLVESIYNQYTKEALASTNLRKWFISPVEDDTQYAVATPAFVDTTSSLKRMWIDNIENPEKSGIFQYLSPSLSKTRNEISEVSIKEK